MGRVLLALATGAAAIIAVIAAVSALLGLFISLAWALIPALGLWGIVWLIGKIGQWGKPPEQEKIPQDES